MAAQPKLVTATEFKVEKGLPIPSSGRGKFKYPFPDMEAGDSFFVAGQGNAGSAATSARNFARRRGYSFKCRSVPGGVRIWRTA